MFTVTSADEINLRQYALQLAVTCAPESCDAEKIVEAANVFFDFLTGNIEFQEEPEAKAA